MTTWSTDDKVSAYVIIDKYINTEKDKKEFISLIMKLKKEELVELFGDISKAVVFPLSVVDNNRNLNQKNKKKNAVESYQLEADARKNAVPVSLATYDTLKPKPKKHNE